MMPGMNGYEVLERMKAVGAELRNIPVIMISALSEIESVVRCIELGAEDYLPKPFNPTLLRARVGASLEKKRLRDEVRASLARLGQEMDAARKLQLGMLPLVFPACTPAQPVEIHALMEPAREVGGDLYDFFYASEQLFCFLVGDVSGKGAAAAMFMARTRSLVRMAVQLWRKIGGGQITPVQIAEAVNRELCQDNRDRMFVTLFLGILDTRTGVLTYVNAGHLAPWVLHASGSVEWVNGKPAMPLAVRAGAAYQERTVTLLPDDTVFVFSDGVTEAMNVADEFYGNERLHGDLRAASALTPEEMVRAIKVKVDAFTGEAPKSDDVTMLALRWRPAHH
jgi:sigma-B regulation protein RsbU (phosphoserine phosphatase)